MNSIILNIFRVLASCTSTMMILSPLPTVYRIYKTKNTGHMSIFPLISVVYNCHTWMLYGVLDENYFPVVTTFTLGDILAIGYVATFYYFTTERPKANRLLAAFAVAILGATIYTIVGGTGGTHQTRDQVTMWAGFIAISSSLVLYTSPLEKLVLVFRHKSAEFIPIQMVMAGALNNVMWIIYTGMTRKWLLLVPNLVTLTSGIFQMIIYFFVYNPKSHPLSEDWKERDSNASTEDADDDDQRESEDLESGTYMQVRTPSAQSDPVPCAQV